MGKNKGFFKRLSEGFKKIQRKIDLTPRLIKISNRYARRNKVSIALFVFFLLAGFFGFFVPIIQGWLAVVLAFSFLGIKPLNRFLERNKQSVSRFGTFLFMITIGLFLFSTASWALGYSEDSPVDNIFQVVNYGKEDFQAANSELLSTIGVDYNNTVQTLSVLNYDQQSGFSTIASD